MAAFESPQTRSVEYLFAEKALPTEGSLKTQIAKGQTPMGVVYRDGKMLPPHNSCGGYKAEQLPQAIRHIFLDSSTGAGIEKRPLANRIRRGATDSQFRL
jgi:hypothetical protein